MQSIINRTGVNPFILSLFMAVAIVAAVPYMAQANYGYDNCTACSPEPIYVSYPSIAPFHPVTLPNMFPSLNTVPRPIVQVPTSYPVPQPYPQPYPVPVPVPQPYPQPYPVPTPVPVYPPLSVSCSANTNYANVGTPVTWTAYVSGGNYGYNNYGYNSYTGYNGYNYNNGYSNGYNNYSNYNNGYNNSYVNYSWSGSDNITGNGQSVTVSYNTPGQKLASVTAYAGGQVVTGNCNNAVEIAGYYPVPQPYPYPYPVPTPTGLDIGCYADPVKAGVNQPVTWSAEVAGGLAPFTYSWTGTNDLSGNQSSVIKFYGTAGEKYAIVSVTSADGRTGTKACSNHVSVGGGTKPTPKPAPTCPCTNDSSYANPSPSPIPSYTNYGQQAGPIFTLSSVPWNWVAILVIIILVVTVVYLMVNRPKI